MTDKPVSSNSPNKRRIAIGLLATLGSIDSLYLTWTKIGGAYAACAGVGDCEAVNASIYSEIAGVPVAALGLAMYALIVVLVWLEARIPALKEKLQMAVFGLALAGLVYSGWLTYVAIEILEAVCPYCVFSAVLISSIFALSVISLVQEFARTD
jgi:uncharacterized membrane protein